MFVPRNDMGLSWIWVQVETDVSCNLYEGHVNILAEEKITWRSNLLLMLDTTIFKKFS